MNQEDRYLVNPDVSCREEGPEGALLFNPDTGDMLVINTSGLIIWQSLARKRTVDEIVTVLNETCDGIPKDRVEEDVLEFIQKLLPGGYIGRFVENNEE